MYQRPQDLGVRQADFKNWNEKLINAVAQVLGTEWRKFMKNLNEKLDQDRKVISESAMSAIDGAEKLENIDQANEDIFCVLVEKTEGEAALRVLSGTPGDGLSAYIRCSCGLLVPQDWRFRKR